MELTQEYFDEQLKNLSSGFNQQLKNLAAKEDVEQFRDDFRAVKSDLKEIKQKLDDLDRRDKEDSDAFAKTLVKHDKRISFVEEKLKSLKLKQA